MLYESPNPPTNFLNHILLGGKILFIILSKVPGTVKALIPTIMKDISKIRYIVRTINPFISNSLDMPSFSRLSNVAYV